MTRSTPLSSFSTSVSGLAETCLLVLCTALMKCSPLRLSVCLYLPYYLFPSRSIPLYWSMLALIPLSASVSWPICSHRQETLSFYHHSLSLFDIYIYIYSSAILIGTPVNHVIIQPANHGAVHEIMRSRASVNLHTLETLTRAWLLFPVLVSVFANICVVLIRWLCLGAVLYIWCLYKQWLRVVGPSFMGHQLQSVWSSEFPECDSAKGYRLYADGGILCWCWEGFYLQVLFNRS